MTAKKVLATLLAVVMVLTSFGMTAFAEDETNVTVSSLEALQEALAAENDLPIVIAETIVIPAGETVVLDLRGKTVTVPESESAHIYALDNQGDLTLKDSVGGGSITARGIYNGYNGNAENAKLTVESGKYVGMDSDGGSAIYNGAKLVINGGEIFGCYSAINNATDTADATINGGKFGGVYFGNLSRNYVILSNKGSLTIHDADIVSGWGGVGCYGGTVVINGGSFMPTGWTNLTSHVVYVGATGNVTINGGVFKMNYAEDAVPNSGEAVASYYSGTVNIAGGEFYAHFDNVSPVQLSSGSAITGGKFMNHSGVASTHAWVKNYVKAGCKLDENGNVISYAAEVDGVYYDTLQAAIDAADAGDNTIKLLADYEGNVIIKQAEGINITFDGNGKAYDGTIYVYGAARYTGAETLTIQNVNFEADKATDFISSNSTDSDKRYAHNVTVQNCTFTSNTTEEVVGLRFRQAYDIKVIDCDFINMYSVMWATGGADGLLVDGIEAVNCQNGISVGTVKEVTVINSTIEAVKKGGYGLRADATGAYALSVENTDVNAYYPVMIRNTNSDTYALNVAAGCELTATNPDGYDVVVTAAGDEVAFAKPAKDINVTIDNTVEVDVYSSHEAIINGVYYKTLEAAVAVAQDGDTITLAGDVSFKTATAFNKDITIDLKGHTLTMTAEPTMLGNEARNACYHFSSDVKFCDTSLARSAKGTIKVSNTQRATGVFYVDIGASLAFENVALVAESYNADALIFNVNEVAFSNAVVNAANNVANGSFITGNGANATNVAIENTQINLDNTGRGFTNSGITANESEIVVENLSANAFRNVAGSINNTDVTIDGCESGIKQDSNIALAITGDSVVSIENATEYEAYLKDTSSTLTVADTATLEAEVKVGAVAATDEVSSEVTLSFVPTANERVYNMYIESVDGNVINRFSDAEFRFALAAEEGDHITYKLTPAENMAITTSMNATDGEAYLFSYTGNQDVVSSTGTKLLIGTVEFTGYGTFAFGADATYAETEVEAATTINNVVKYYTLEGTEGTDKVVLTNSTTGTITYEVAKRDVEVTIDFTNNITAGAAADYNDMTVTLVAANGDTYVGKVGSGSDANVQYQDGAASVTFEFEVVADLRYDITVEGAGYRTANYSTLVPSGEGAVSIKFWNNAQDDDKPIAVEEKVAASEKTVTFLAGDIVEDDIIDIYDLSAAVSYFGQTLNRAEKSDLVKYDLNRDGRIDARDVAYVLVSWGK